jgi:hypothetical protein
MINSIEAEILYRSKVISTVAFECIPRVGEYIAGTDDGFYVVDHVRHVLVDDAPAQVQIIVSDADDTVRKSVLGK